MSVRLTYDADDELVALLVDANEQRVVHDEVRRQELCVVSDGHRQNGLGVRPDVQGRVDADCGQQQGMGVRGVLLLH